jgi:hypothetical protein
MSTNLSADKRKLNVAAVHAEVEEDGQSLPRMMATGKPAPAPKSITVSGFARIYKEKVRPAMLTAASLLRLFKRSDSANGVMQAIAFLDLIVGGEVPVE